jgi:hypothetical protein
MTTPTPTTSGKLNKPPARKEGEPEIIEFENRTWKWCDKCFGGTWNRTHVTADHQPGLGRNKNRRKPDTTPETPKTTLANTTLSPLPTPSTIEAHMAATSDYNLDFI